MASGVWSLPVEDQGCSGGSKTEQLLADISSSAVTESNSQDLSTQLAYLSPESPLSLQELNTVTDLAAALVQAGSADVLVRSIVQGPQHWYMQEQQMYNSSGTGRIQ